MAAIIGFSVKFDKKIRHYPAIQDVNKKSLTISMIFPVIPHIPISLESGWLAHLSIAAAHESLLHWTHIMRLKFVLSLVAVATMTSLSFGDVITGSALSPVNLSTNDGSLDPVGSNFDAGVTVFGPGGGAFLTAGNLTFPGGSIGLNPIGATGVEEIFVDVTATSLGGGSEKIFISWSQTPTGSSMIPPGSLLAGLPIETIGFEMGSNNLGNNGLEWTPSSPFSIDAVEFNLIDITGASLFTSTDTAGAIINADGSLGYAFFVGTGPGSDLSGLGVAGGTVSITITEAVPEPASAALLSVLGAAFVIRRRR